MDTWSWALGRWKGGSQIDEGHAQHSKDPVAHPSWVPAEESSQMGMWRVRRGSRP